MPHKHTWLNLHNKSSRVDSSSLTQILHAFEPLEQANVDARSCLGGWWLVVVQQLVPRRTCSLCCCVTWATTYHHKPPTSRRRRRLCATAELWQLKAEAATRVGKFTNWYWSLDGQYFEHFELREFIERKYKIIFSLYLVNFDEQLD